MPVSTHDNKSRISLPIIGAVFGVWTLLGLFWATRLYFSYNQGGEVIVPWSVSVTWGLIDFYAWGALSPLVILLARKIRIERDAWLAPGLIHLTLSVVFAALQLLIFSGLYIMVGGLEYGAKSSVDMGIWGVWKAMVLGKLHSSIIIYWGILIATLALDYHRRLRVEKLKAAEMSTRLARSELAALKMQLHPHFLFNTLNTIASLVREQPDEAEKTVVRLADLLRTSLKGASDSGIPLREEILFIEKYLAIEGIRFQDRLKIEMNIADEVLDANIPALILQPLVENAVKHGIATLERDGLLTVAAYLASDKATLVLQVTDNGPGFPEDWESVSENRIGLANTRERLRQLYDDKQQFSITSLEPTGAQVTIELPFKHSPRSEND